MSSFNRESRVAVALDYLRSQKHFHKFDNQESVVKVGIDEAVNVDEATVHIGSLHDLEELTFYGTGPSDEAFVYLASLVNLKKLSIYQRAITSAGLAHLSPMTRLEYLYLNDASGLDLAAFNCVARLPSLRKLSLCRGDFSDADLAPLAALANLKELSLSECPHVHGTFCQNLIHLPQLRDLSLDETNGQITDDGLACIAELPNLEHLFVGTLFTDTGAKRLRKLTNLKTLCLRSEHVTTKGVAVVSQLSRLDTLYLDTPLLSDEILPALLACTRLESLVFTRSALSDAGLQRLRDGLPKCGVDDMQRDPYEFGYLEYVKDANEGKYDQLTPFLTLLAQACDVDLVDSTFVKIGHRYDHLVDATQYTPEERVIMLVWHSTGIIGNGGFEYLFAGEFPGDPNYHCTAQAYQTAGLVRSYEAFREAFALFPGGVVRHDPAERDRLYNEANRSARERLNRKLWQDRRDGTTPKKLAEFIKRNAVRLGDLDAAH